MCWNIQISILSAVVGWATCLYLYYRQRSERDTFYARYLLTFTFTQLVDAFLWSLNDKKLALGESEGLVACRPYQLQFSSSPTDKDTYQNYMVSKYLLPLIVFSQHATQLMYPSAEYKKNPKAMHNIILAHSFPCLVMSYCFACTMLTDANFPYGDKTLFWGGDFSEFPFALIQLGATLHSGLVAFGFYYFCQMKGPVLYAHVIPLGCVVTFLWITEGRMDFGSKWCSYCLIYSLVYVCEPWWYPEGAEATTMAPQTTRSRTRTKSSRAKSAGRTKTPAKKNTKKKTSAKKKTIAKTSAKKRRAPSKK